MREISKSPCEYYIRFLISCEDDPCQVDATRIYDQVSSLNLYGMSAGYIREVATSMEDRPNGYDPNDLQHKGTREYLRHYRIYDMWNQAPAVREANLILGDAFLREKLEPMLISSVTQDRKSVV